MNGKVLFILFLICNCYSSRPFGANNRVRRIRPIAVVEGDEDYVLDDDDGKIVNSTFAKTMTKFSCMSEVEGAELLVYGTKAWRFPEQDINLTLTYPPDSYDGRDVYMITGFKVLLFADTMLSRGYINSGGVFENHVSLSFISPEVNMLVYQFWLYGIPKSHTFHETSHILYHDLC